MSNKYIKLKEDDDIAIVLIITLSVYIFLCYVWNTFGYWWWENLTL